MKQKLLNKLWLRVGMIVAVMTTALAGTAWAQSDYSTDYTGNVTLSTEGGTKATACVVKIQEGEVTNSYNGIKAGTGSVAGAMVITVPSGTKYLHMHVACWGTESVTLSVTPEGYSDDIALTPESGIAGNSPFTLNATTDPSSSDYYKVITFASALTEDTDLTFTATSGKRFVVWGVTAEADGGSGDDQSVATTVTIDDSGITNTNVFNGTDAGSLAATVSAGETTIENAVVTWSGNNDEVATIDATTGAVTLVAAGTVTFKAEYAGVEGTYKPSSKNYVMTVINSDPNGPGSENKPYTVAEARAAIDANAGVTGVYATGIVSKIVTAYNSTYGNISYNISEDGTETADQLQAFRGFSYNGEWFTSEDDIKVGDVVVIYGNLKKYGSTYEFDAGNQLVSLERPVGPVLPVIKAEDVTLEYDASYSTITYTLENEVAGGTLTASTTSDWLTLGEVDETNNTVPLLFDPNNGAARTAVVTLTYTYGEESVTKDVTVTQEGNTAVINKISDITAAGTYTVEGTIVAKSKRGFIVGDGTGYVYYFNSSYDPTDYDLGDEVKLSGSVVVYGGVFEFNNSTTISDASGSNYASEEPTVLTGADMDARVASTTPAQLSSFVQYEGTLSVSGTYYNITNIDGATTALGSISFPLNIDFTALDGKKVKVTGYYVGISSSKYYNTMIGSIEEVVTLEPSIEVGETTIDAFAAGTDGVIIVDYKNITTVVADVQFFEADGTTPATYDWVTCSINEINNVTYIISENTSTDARTAYMKVHALDDNANDVYSKLITFTQAGYVPDYATLPFVFNGKKADIEATAGLTQNGLSSDYAASPYLKFDGTGDWLVLKINEEPGLVAFDIKGNGFSDGTFTVQASADGEAYTDLGVYTELGATQSESFVLPSEVRYIKWIYTEKVKGNVGLGNIKVYPNKPVEVTVGEAGYATMYLPYAVQFGGVVMTNDLPTPVGAWTFDDPQNPLAGTGTATLTPANHSTAKPTWLETRESLEAAGIQVIDGGLYLPKGSSLLMNTNNGANGFDKYTVMFDICADDMTGYNPLWQNSMTDSKDGSLFIKNGQVGLGGSLGYNGDFKAGQWYRVVLVIDTPNKAALYVDGELLSTCEHTDAYNKHWLLPEPGAVFFADEDGEEKDIKVTGLRFWDVPLTANQVAILGTTTATAEGATTIASLPEATSVWTFDDANDLTAGTGVATMTATSGVVANADGSVTVAEGDNLQITTNLPETSLDSYTLMMDVKFPDVARYTSLIQTDLDNVNDACLFVHNGQVGINSGGMGYHGALEADTWYRLVFVVDGLIASEYVDGVLIGKGSSQLPKWGICGGGFFLFEDEDDDNDEGIATTTEIRFWNQALTPAQVALLGTIGEESVLKAYTGTVSGEYLILNEVKGTVPAFTPVVLKAAPNTYALNYAENVAPIEENDLKGTLEPIEAAGKYVLAKPEGKLVGFYHANTGTIAAGKAYLDASSNVKAFYFDLGTGADEDPTGIADMSDKSDSSDSSDLSSDAAIYNLAGQRLQKMQRGINIVNGKKILK